jgi:hypothetical protein
MHFDQREQRALREAGLSTDDIEAASDAVAGAAARDAERLEAFFDRETVYSDMDRAHSDSEIQEHSVDFLDLYTHSDEIRGYLRFDRWGVWVAGGRILADSEGERSEPSEHASGEEQTRERADSDPELVELTLGPTVHDRVRFAPDPGKL